MRFVNNGPHRRISLGPSENRKRVGLNRGQEIDLPGEVGRALRLDRVTKGKIGKTKVETKQFEYTPDDDFYKEIIKIKGIGNKTAIDIVEWGTKEKLIEQIKLKEHIPFRDDVVKKLRKKYE